MTFQNNLLKEFNEYCTSNNCKVSLEDDQYDIVIFTKDNVEILLNYERSTKEDSAFFIVELGTTSEQKEFPILISSILQSGKTGFSIYDNHLYLTLKIIYTLKMKKFDFDASLVKLVEIYKQKEDILSYFRSIKGTQDDLNKRFKTI